MSIGIDVAAEHLRQSEGLYKIGKDNLEGTALLDIYQHLLYSYPISYLEDPFDPGHPDLWASLTRYNSGKALIVGDDLFATNSNNITEGLANGILLKMNQIGTLSATLRAAAHARRYQMTLCLSHRSCETEDTAVCDLATALGADLVKVGGPRRGDRIAKYNQLLRLAEIL
ncbi:MAG: hypothetical protein IT329_12040 [Caldilineaceae bacterium]|nr:hypothetical protein [Caldilineaceae bacterium]